MDPIKKGELTEIKVNPKESETPESATPNNEQTEGKGESNSIVVNPTETQTTAPQPPADEQKPSENILEDIKGLYRLKEKNIITEEEFNLKKINILGIEEELKKHRCDKSTTRYCWLTNRLYPWRRIIGGLIIAVGIGIILVLSIYVNKPSDPLEKIGLVGLGTFLSVLTGAFLITDEWNLNMGEFRKAITISIVSVYFFIMAYGKNIITSDQTLSYGFAGSNITLANGTSITLANGTIATLNSTTSAILTNSSVSSAMVNLYTNILGGIFDNFWIIVALVIGAYFAEKGYEIKKQKDVEQAAIEKESGGGEGA